MPLVFVSPTYNLIVCIHKVTDLNSTPYCLYNKFTYTSIMFCCLSGYVFNVFAVTYMCMSILHNIY